MPDSLNQERHDRPIQVIGLNVLAQEVRQAVSKYGWAPMVVMYLPEMKALPNL